MASVAIWQWQCMGCQMRYAMADSWPVRIDCEDFSVSHFIKQTSIIQQEIRKGTIYSIRYITTIDKVSDGGQDFDWSGHCTMGNGNQG